MVGNSKIDERAKFKKWRENTLAVTINIIRQKERNKINLNLLNYLKRYLFAQRLWLKMMNQKIIF